MGFLKKVEREVKSAGRKIDDQILQPVKNTVEAIVEDPKKLLAVGIAVAFPGAGAALGAQLGLTGVAAQVAGQALLNTTLNGGDVKSAVIGAVLPVVGNAGAATIGDTLSKSGITGSLNTILTRAVSQGTTAALLGKDPAAAFLLGGISAGVNAVTENIPGFTELPMSAQNAITTAATAKFAGADVSDAVSVSLVNDAMTFAINKMDEFKKTGGITNRIVDEDIPQGDATIDTITSGLKDKEVTDVDIAKSVTDFLSNKPDYSLTTDITFPKTEGLKVEPITGAGSTVGESPVDYSLSGGDVLGGLGLNMPTSPNIDKMGGGQGLTVNTPEGVLSEEGVTKTGTASNLGDPDSFINKPAPDVPESSVDYSKFIKAGAQLLGTAAIGAAVSSATKSSTSLSPVNLEYGDIYKDAPIKGFSMRKGEDGKYTPFIGERAQLAKGGFVDKPIKPIGLASRR